MNAYFQAVANLGIKQIFLYFGPETGQYLVFRSLSHACAESRFSWGIVVAKPNHCYASTKLSHPVRNY